MNQNETNDNDMLREVMDMRKQRDADIPPPKEEKENELMRPQAGEDEK